MRAVFLCLALVSALTNGVIWQGGGVTLYENYSYTATFNGSGVDLTDGGYAIMCGGKNAPLRAVNHSLSHGTHGTLGSFEAATVSLVAIGGACNGTRLFATFKHFANTNGPMGAVVFTQTFPDGVLNTTASTDGSDTGSDAESLPHKIHDEPHTCPAQLEQNTDYQGNDIKFVSNITDPGVCCSLCVAEPKCVGFSLMGSADDKQKWAKRCYLKSAMPKSHKYNTHISAKIPGRQGPTPAPAPGPDGHPTLPPKMASAFPLWSNPISSPPSSTSTDTSWLGWLTWGGMFMGAKWGSNAGTGGDESGGPIVLFDTAAAHGDGVMLSTFDEHFTSQVSISGYGFAGGVSSNVATIAKGYTSSFLLCPGTGGVNSIVMNWGATLQLAFNATSSQGNELAAKDVVTTKLGYWTDNQAYYDWYHWVSV
jgi:hypothetical protein